jgi:levansucrase
MIGTANAAAGEVRFDIGRWQQQHVSNILTQNVSVAPSIAGSEIERVAPDLDIWDAWPVQDDDGSPSQIAPGETLWMALGSPQFVDPDERHSHARIHLLHHAEGSWHHLGPVMPEGFSPGSREWSGSALLGHDGRTLTLFFTATGRRDEAELTFEQRLFSAQATLVGSDENWTFKDWRDLREIVKRDPDYYMASDAGTGKVGTIKAFRDPAYFRDPADGRRLLFFAGSGAKTTNEFNGVIGAITASADGEPEWLLLPPVIDATGVNNELERPHVVLHDGLYYLFWSTQSHVFAPTHTFAPTGLYGMVASSLGGEWRPLNGTGLVFANPEAAPRQAYSWLVLPDLSVISFIDDWGRGRDAAGPRRFGATFAPVLRLRLTGETAALDD